MTNLYKLTFFHLNKEKNFLHHLRYKSKAATTSWITCSCFIISNISAQSFSKKFFLRVQKVAEGYIYIYIYILKAYIYTFTYHKIGQSQLFVSCQNPPWRCLFDNVWLFFVANLIVFVDNLCLFPARQLFTFKLKIIISLLLSDTENIRLRINLFWHA